MTAQNNIPSLEGIDYLPYLDAEGQINSDFQKKVGVYAIFDGEKMLQYIGYSRDIATSLKQHFMRQPEKCYWLKVETIERPNRTFLEEIRQGWMAENGATPAGNSEDEDAWTQAIDVKPLMTAEEKENYEKTGGDDLAQRKLLKNIARRVEEEILERLKTRGLQEKLRFNPKLKESGLLDLK